MLLRFILFILVTTSVHLQSVDETIDSCIADTENFTSTETKYIAPFPDYLNEPSDVSPSYPEIQLDIYAKLTRQRVFECITDRLDEESLENLESNQKYQELVNDCKSERIQYNCDPTYPYRMINGSCNNLMHPNWGAVNACLKRFLPGNYEGATGFRKSVCGGDLPDPRFLSLSIHIDKYRPTSYVNHMLTFIGQLGAHDTTNVGLVFVGYYYIECCGIPEEKQHPACIPIHMEEDDPFYSMFNLTCFNLVRTAACDTCSIGSRNQLNTITSYIDLSFIYGESDSLAAGLRCNNTGKLLFQSRKAGELAPPDLDLGICGSEEKEEYCFRTGDPFVNFGPPSMALQTMFIREHNRIVDIISETNSCWNNEMVYQETRNINIAEWQVIVYRELLPLLIGPEFMSRYDLWIKEEGCTVYDSSVEATLIVEFTTAAYRLHTLLNNNLTDHSLNNFYNRARNTFNSVHPIYQGKMDSVMQGLCTSPGQKYDRFMMVDITDFLYRTGTSEYGLDIAAIHIQRGRDNGIPTYREMVYFLSNGTIDIQTFEDLEYFMDTDNIEILESVYCDVRDLDLWVGMMNERVLDNMVVGPTAAEIIAIQFSNWKFGDRFYFEHCGNFNDDQLKTLRNITLSSLMCLNTNISDIQPQALLFPSETNPNISCSDVPEVNLNLWKADCEGSSK